MMETNYGWASRRRAPAVQVLAINIWSSFLLARMRTGGLV